MLFEKEPVNILQYTKNYRTIKHTNQNSNLERQGKQNGTI